MTLFLAFILALLALFGDFDLSKGSPDAIVTCSGAMILLMIVLYLGAHS